MFSIYGVSGQVFSGTMEEMTRVNALARARAARGIARDGDELGIEATVGAATLPRDDAVNAYRSMLPRDLERGPLYHASQIMQTGVVRLNAGDSVAQAWRTLRDHAIHQAPVMDDDARLVGIVSERDLLTALNIDGGHIVESLDRVVMNTSLINTEILPFKATAFHNGKFVDVTEATLKGKWSVVFFYPADFTFVCPTELGDMADFYPEFQKLGVEIYGVSTDTHFTHKAWHDTSETIGKINYPMIGDPTGTLTRNFGVMIEEAGLAERGTFVMDPQGKIQIIEINAGGIGRDASELLRKVKAAQYVASHPGEVCPAKWKEGEATLAPSLDLVGKI
jgi:peroxiredoxin